MDKRSETRIFLIRFVVLSACLLGIAAAYVYLIPHTYRTYVCEFYEDVVSPRLKEAVVKANQEAGTDAGATEQRHEDPDGLDRQIRDLICHDVDAPAKVSVDLGKFLQGAVPTCVGIAFTICKIIPRRPSSDEAKEREPERRLVAVKAVPAGERDKKLVTLLSEYRELAIRSTQIRAILWYSLLGAAVALFIPPTRVPGMPMTGPIAHLVGLIVITIITAAWCMQRPALRYPSYPGVRMSLKVGFGSIFLAGVIALLMSLPYRTLSAPVETRMDTDRVALIAGIRLVLLPVASFIAALLCLAIVRKANGLEVQAFASHRNDENNN